MALLIPPKHRSADFARSVAPLVLWEFSTELFDVSTGERMLDQFLCLVESSVRHPDKAIEGLSMMDKRERDHVLAFGLGAVSPPEFLFTECSRISRLPCPMPLPLLWAGIVLAMAS
jgi:hypothetical protein